MKLDLLMPGIEVGLVTTDLDAMVAFYEGFLELEPQGEIDFDGGSQRRYALGATVLKLVTYTAPPAAPAAPGGGRAQAGLRYFTIGVNGLRAVAEEFAASAVRGRGAAHRVRARAGDGVDVRRRPGRQPHRTVRHAVSAANEEQK